MSATTQDTSFRAPEPAVKIPQQLNLTGPTSQSLRKVHSFVLRYDFGKKEVPDGAVESAGLNLLILIDATIRDRGNVGRWSFLHHLYSGDFFNLTSFLLSEISGLGRKDWREGWDYLESLKRSSDSAKSRGNFDEMEKIHDTLLEFVRSVQEQLVWRNDATLASALKSAARGFVKKQNGNVQILAASMDWFLEEWGRDTFISLPGLLLATEHFKEAKSNILQFAKHERGGLIPNRIPDAAKPETAEYNTVDGPLWFANAVRKYAEYTEDWSFVGEMMPVLRKIFAAYRDGAEYVRNKKSMRIYMDADGLIVCPAQSTWMDADPDGKGRPVTPRNGKCVEINALWYSGLKFMALAEFKTGTAERAGNWTALSQQTKDSFNDKFWNEQGQCLFDVVEGDPHRAAVRPNMVLAVSHGEDLISPERQIAVVKAAREKLLTPFGLRTLSPQDSRYKGLYFTEKPAAEKDLAYHQGTVWPWLMGPYVSALVRARQYEERSAEQIQSEVRRIVTPLCEYLLTSAAKSLPEVFDGDAPHRAGGTRSQAWSVAELVRVTAEHLHFEF